MPTKRKRVDNDHSASSETMTSNETSEPNGSGKTTTKPTEADERTVRSDLNALVRVKHRLTMVDTTEKLSSVLQKLLPRLFLKMNDNYLQLSSSSSAPAVREIRQQMHDQFIELLSQTMKRVRDETACLVPCVDILQGFMTASTDQPDEKQITTSSNLKSFNIYTVNLALAFVQVGIGRGSMLEDSYWWTLLPMLCAFLEDSCTVYGAASSSHERITHLLITTLLGIVKPTAAKGRAAAPDDDRLAGTRAVVSPRPAMVYDLFLDVLLYQPMAGTIPPAGLSNTGWNRLKSGPWNHDRAALCQLKLAVLDFVVPGKRYRLFLEDSKARSVDHESQSLNIARTLVLLVVASSDPALREVSEFASSQLKQHLDSLRMVGSNKDGMDVRHSVFGDPMAVVIELIALCLGQVHAESILKSSRRLGVSLPSSSTTPQRLDKRRPLDEMSQSPVLMTFVSNNILNEYPTLFEDHSLDVILSFSGVVIQLAQRILSTVTGGLSTLRAKPYLAAAGALNALAIRLCALYDRLYDTNDSAALTDVLCRTLSITCDVLIPVATSAVVSQTSRATMVGYNDGSIAVRDACYGIVATLSRSQFAVHPHGYLFGRGKASATSPKDSSNGDCIVSIDTASTLFGCTSNEEERLRPRAVAALDALLAAYCRACVDVPTKPSVDIGAIAPQSKAPESSNPWLTAQSVGNAIKTPSISEGHFVLAKSLVPLLWAAARSHQPKASRVAAARWAGALLKDIDLLNACHILCFLSGDSDTVVSSIAREGLGLPPPTSFGDEFLLATNSSDYTTSKFPDFYDFATKLFAGSQSSRQQLFWDFSCHGRIATLRCGLFCLLNDLYGGNDAAVGTYLTAIMKSLQEVIGLCFQIDESSSQGTASIDLLDECSACLLSTLSASQYARLQIAGKGTMKLPISITEIQKFAVSVNSSRSRRFFAAVCGKLFEDMNIWSSNPAENCDAWLEETKLSNTLEICSNHLVDVEKRNPSIGRLHGSSFLGAHCVRALRLLILSISDRQQSLESYNFVNNILQLLGKGVLHDDDIVSNACSDSLAIAFSYDTTDAPSLDFRFCISAASVVSNLTKALNKFGHGDAVNPARTLKIVKASGVCLAATGSTSDLNIDVLDGENRIILQCARLECVNALFELLGSISYRKEEEISIVVGESLALFADFSFVCPKAEVWPREFDTSFANQLPPYELVLYVLLRKIFAASSPHKRTACAPALLAIVARGTQRVSSGRAKWYVNTGASNK
jgi:proteasome component ECM29